MGVSNIVSKIQELNPFKSKGSVIGVDIGSSSIKIVEIASSGGKIKLLKYGTLATGPFAGKDVGVSAQISDDKIVQALNTALEAIGIKTRKGGIAIPLKLSLIVTLELPAQAEDNLDKVVPIEARKYIPMPPSEVDLAWSIIAESNRGSLNAEKNKEKKNIKILVAAIHNNTIESYNQIAQKSGINPVIFEIETFSALRSVFGEDMGTFMLVDIGAEKSKAVITDYGSITISHTINKGSQNFTETIASALSISFKEAEKIKRKYGLYGKEENADFLKILNGDIDYIFEETKKIVEDFEKTNNKKISKIVFIGGGSLLKGITEYAKQYFSKEIALGDPFKNIEPPTPLLSSILKTAGPEFSVCVGIATRAINEL